MTQPHDNTDTRVERSWLWLFLAIFTCLLLVSLWPKQAASGDSIIPNHTETGSVEFVGHIGGVVEAVFVVGDLAYVGQGSHLTIMDISTPSKPIPLGQTEAMPDRIVDIHVSENLAFVANHNRGLRVVDVSDPSTPVEVGAYDTLGVAYGVFVSENLAYVADYDGGLRVVDVSNPSAPVEVGAYDTPGYAFDVFVSGSLAYVADGLELRVVDVSNPSAPVEVGVYDSPAVAYGVFVSGSLAYVAARGYGLRVVDVSNPSAPVEIGAYETGYASNVFVSGSLAYVVAGATGNVIVGLRVVDVSTPSAPVEVGAYDTPGSALGVFVSGSLAYVADGDSGLRVVDVSNPGTPVEVGAYEIPGEAMRIFVSGSLAYVTDFKRMLLLVIDVSNPSAPVEVGAYAGTSPPGLPLDVFVSGNLAYVTDIYGLRVVDVSNPSAPVEIGVYGTLGSAIGVFVSGSLAYVTDVDNGLRILDVSNPSVPVEVGAYETTSGVAPGVFVSGNLAYVADVNGVLRVVDVSNPSAPVEVGAFDTPGTPSSVFASGNLAYVADRDSGLRILDVSNPSAPVEVGAFDTPSTAYGVYVSGSLAYVTDEDGGLRMVDVSNPSAPVEVGAFDTPGTASSVYVSGDLAYVTDGTGGLYILKYSGVDSVPTPTLTPTSTPSASPTPTPTPTPPSGSGKPAIVFVHGWNGLSVFNGLSEACESVKPDNYFMSVDNDLEAAGYDKTYARLETSTCYTPSIKDNVPRLKAAIEEAKRKTGQEKVILIAHSMGGLVSRAYIEGDAYDDDVSELFTFGSPHLGVPGDVLIFLANGVSLGEFCEWQEAVCDFSELGMVLFNQTYSTRTTGVTYHAVTGYGSLLSRNPLGIIFDKLIRKPNDGIVPVYSGIGLSGQVDRMQTDEVHTTVLGPRTYFTRTSLFGNASQSVSYTDCLEPVLVDKVTDRCGSSAKINRSESPPELSTYLPLESGTLQTGQLITRTMDLPVGTTLFAAHWQTGTIGVHLVTPGGQVIDPAYASSHPAEVSYSADDIAATYSVTDTVAGSWRMVLTAQDVPAKGSAYTTFAAFDSDVVLRGGTDRPWYSPGSTATITATIGGAPVTTVVTATILRTDGVTDTLVLQNTGTDAFEGSYTVPDAPGYTEVRFRATGRTADDAPFERGVTRIFQIASATAAALSSTYADRGEDSTGDSQYEALVVDIGVTSSVSGTFTVAAELVSASTGTSIDRAATSADLITGTHTLTLRFDAETIRAAQQDGPYRVTSVLLIDNRGAALPVQEASDVWITAAYRWQDFGNPERIYLPNVLTPSTQ